MAAMALLAAPHATTAVATPTAATTPTASDGPMRYSLRVAKHGKDTRVVRLAIVVPAGPFSGTCNNRGGSCPSTGAVIKMARTDLPDGKVKWVLPSTKRRPAIYPKGVGLTFTIPRNDDHPSAFLRLTFTGPGKYEALLSLD